MRFWGIFIFVLLILNRGIAQTPGGIAYLLATEGNETRGYWREREECGRR